MFCFHQPDVEPAGLKPRTHPYISLVVKVQREFLTQRLHGRFFKDSQESYDFYRSIKKANIGFEE